jgi:endoglucanase
MVKLPTPTAEKLPSNWKGFNFLNMFYQKDETWDNKYSEDDFKLISEWGFNFVRLPVDYRILIKGKDWNEMNEEAMRQLDEAVEFGKAWNVHTCINLHRAPGYTVAHPPEKTNLWKDKEPQEAFAKMWAFIAQRYKGTPNENLSFNFINEPESVADEAYTAVIKKAAAAIREKDPERLLIADGLDWATEPSTLLQGLGIAQATRGYEPHQFTHYKADWVKGSNKYPLPVWPTKEMSPEEFKEKNYKSWENLKNSGCGVVVGEWGCHNKTPHDVVLKWMKDMLTIFKETGLGWALWNLKGSFGVLNSGRADVDYEDFNGQKLDRKMLDLLLEYV